LKIIKNYLTAALPANGFPVQIRIALVVVALPSWVIYKRNQTVLYENRRWQLHPPPRFENLDSLWCWHNNLRFKNKHLWRISESLLLPAEHHLENGSWTNMLIVFLLRLGANDKWIKLENEISVEYSRMSRVFMYVILCNLPITAVPCYKQQSIQ
jgi:hypothetical protein